MKDKTGQIFLDSFHSDLPEPQRMESACSPVNWPSLVHSSSLPETGCIRQRYKQDKLNIFYFLFRFTAPAIENTGPRHLSMSSTDPIIRKLYKLNPKFPP